MIKAHMANFTTFVCIKYVVLVSLIGVIVKLGNDLHSVPTLALKVLRI